MNESLLGAYKLKPEHTNEKIYGGTYCFELYKGAVVFVKQVDNYSHKVMIDFGGISDWCNYSVLDYFVEVG